jgi:hypothetical protein
MSSVASNDDKVTADPSLLAVDAKRADPLYAFLAEHANVAEATPAQNQAIRRKFYYHLLPVVFCLNLLLCEFLHKLSNRPAPLRDAPA